MVSIPVGPVLEPLVENHVLSEEYSKVPGVGSETIPPVVTFVGLGPGISLTSVLIASGVTNDPRGSVRDRNDTRSHISVPE